jgi:acyl CoA:acetate/3-ketoacid CoA transferase beta subunit
MLRRGLGNLGEGERANEKQCVFDVDFTNGLTLVELADGVTVEEVRAKTGAEFNEITPML